jgi:hypothetical protein
MTPAPKLSRRKAWLLGLGIWGTALLAAVALSHFAKLNFWACLGMTAGAVVVNGLVATLEDDLPGGFNNPDGEAHSEVRGHHRLGASRPAGGADPVLLPGAGSVLLWFPIAVVSGGDSGLGWGMVMAYPTHPSTNRR